MSMCCGIFGITDGTLYRRQNLPPMATFSQKQPRLVGFTQVSRGGVGREEARSSMAAVGVLQCF